MRLKSTFYIPLLIAIHALLSNSTHGSEFYAYYTRLPFEQPVLPELLADIPDSAARVFLSGAMADSDGQGSSATKLPSAEALRVPIEKYRQQTEVRWGRYADLIVHLDEERQFVFSRRTGYRPYLETPRGRFPVQRLVDYRDDPMCLCSYVRLIEATPRRIVVHWRHVPDPARVVMTQVIHELFTFTPDGMMQREIRVGRPRLDEYRDPANVILQQTRLTESGTVERSLARGVAAPTPDNPSTEMIEPVRAAPVRQPAVDSPAVEFTFDDGLNLRNEATESDPGVGQAAREVPPNSKTRTDGDHAIETVSGASCSIDGNTALWKRGVSGTALGFDGYFSKVALPAKELPKLSDQLTLEAWVALGAYPWSDAGVVHRAAGEPIGKQAYKHGYRDPYTYRPWKMRGYLLGIDPYGRPIFKLNGQQVGGGVVEPEETVDSASTLPTYRWAHLAATYDGERMSLYIDGQLVDSRRATGPIKAPDRDLLIGLNGDPQRISDPVSHSAYAVNNNLPLIYGIEGLIDEVRIYDRALSADEVARSCARYRPSEAELAKPDLQPRILPGAVTGKPAPRFGAAYRTLRYHELWDNLWRPSPYRDLLVRFDTVPGNVVFWQGPNFGSGWVTENNKWMSDQSKEIGGPHGCAEHMADKRGRFGHVRLIENTPARVVVHWRYPSIDVGYVFPSVNVWVDEYYFIYPDGVGVRFVEGVDGGWHDTQFLSQPGTTCLDNVELNALSVANLRGETAELTWEKPNRVPANPLKDACIKRINFRSQWKVFAIYREGVEITQWGATEQSKHTPDPFAGPWNHWPVGLNPSDGRYAVAADRVTHAAIGGTRPGARNLIMYGFTDQPVESLIPLARSWNRPPVLSAGKGCEGLGYDPTQRAYRLRAKAPTMSFTLEGTEDSPIHHPCFVVRDWSIDGPARVTLDGQPAKAGEVRQGVVRDTRGKPALVLWLKHAGTAPLSVQLTE